MKKFNVSCSVLANIFSEGIEAENKTEAFQKFKEMFEGCNFVDWAEWNSDVEITESIDYSEKLNDVLKKMGLSDEYKVSNMSEVVYTHSDFTILSVNFKVLDKKGSEIATSGKVFFVVFCNGELFLPIKKSLGTNYEISFNYMNNDGVDTPSEMNLTKVFFTNGEETLAYTHSYKFLTFQYNGEPTLLGQRVDYITKKVGIEGLYVTNSDDYDLELTSSDKKIDFSASYNTKSSFIPERLTKIEAII